MHPPRFPSASGLCLLLLAPFTLSAKVIIAEFDATNRSVIEDADGSSPDWIELRNTGASAVNLEGWALSDDPEEPEQWIFPSVNLAAGANLMVFASGKDWRYSGVELHTNFSLSDKGEDLVLSHPDGVGGWAIEHAWLAFPKQHNGFTYGLADSSENGTGGYFVTPTPNAKNGSEVVTEFVGDTDFSHHRGFYDAAFTLTITSETPGASIVYTTDGSEPTSTHGTVVPPANTSATPSATIAISTTTIVRARAFKAGMAPTNVDTQSYIFPSDVLQQSASSIKQPYATWGHSGPDWAMDTKVTQHSNPEDRAVAGDLEKIPTVSVAMNWADLFGSAGPGIYIEGEGIDKPASFEILNPDGNDLDPNLVPGEIGRGMIRVFGGSSTDKRWKTDKLSFRFNFWDNLETEVLGAGAVGEYDRLVLDARLNNVWNQSQNLEQRQFADYCRDAVLTDLENEIGVAPSVHSQHVHLYLNGIYWGLYTLHERADNHFAEAYFGGDSDDYDVVKHGPDEDNFLVDGIRLDPRQPISNSNYSAGVNYLAMVALSQQDLSIQANYDALAEKLDIPTFIVHILTNFTGGNYDWPQHNWYASYNRESGEGKWRFHSWDAEHVFKYVDYPRYDDVTGKFEGEDRPDGINLQLLRNPEYRMLFADTAHRLIFNDGPLSAARIWTAFERRFDDIDEAIRAESARWGDNAPKSGELHLRYSNVPANLSTSEVGQSDTTDFASWWHERERIRTKILGAEPNRITRFIAQLRNATYHEDHPLARQPNPMYPATDAPVFNQHGGSVETGFSLVLMNPNAGGAGIIYYTFDGSDPRKPFSDTSAFFSGAVNDTAIAYSAALTLDATTTVKSRVLLDGEWSALNEATFQVGAVEPASAANLVISEIHYHPANPSSAETNAGFDDDGFFEFFEVRNVGDVVISLAGLSADKGVDLAPLDDGVTTLNPGESALYVANVEAFTLRYGSGLPIAGVFANDTALSNGGEKIHLKAADGSTIVEFEYDDADPWPTAPDGGGPSLVLIQPGARDPAKGWNWRASASANGTPASDDFLSYATWAEAWFSASDPGYPQIAAPDADADGDGLTNLEEHFLGTDPREATPIDERPAFTLESLDLGVGPATYAIFTFRYDRLAEEVLFAAEGSENLATWSSDHLVLLEPPTVHEDGTETRRFRSALPIDSTTALFFLLRLDQR